MTEQDADNESFKTCDEKTYMSESEITYTQETYASEENRPMSHIMRLQSTIASLQERVQQLELQKRSDLTQDDIQTLSTKNMLQKIDTYEQGESSTSTDVFLFLKALAAGKKVVNVKIDFSSPEIYRSNLPSTYQIFPYPITYNDWNVQFFITENEAEIEFPEGKTWYHWILRGVERKYENTFAYKMILKSPENRSFEIVARSSDPLLGGPVEQLEQETITYEEIEFGEKINVHENNAIGRKNRMVYKQSYLQALGSPDINCFPRLPITWTIIQLPS